MMARYRDRPFLRLVDAWMLDAIGHLPRHVDKALSDREAQFALQFGERGRWRDMVARRLDLPPGMAGAVREVWMKGRPRFVAAHGHEPDPGEFVRTFVDTRFPH